jgi:hypothetical protein
MATDHEREHLDPRDVRNPHTRYERRTFNVRLVLLTMAAMAVAGVLVHFFVAGMWTLLDKEARAKDQEHKPMLSSTPGPNVPPRLPPEPRLQPDPVSDLHRMREAEDNVLQTYGWVDKNAGVVRIPVARALDLLAQRGLPNWGNAAPGTQAAGATPAAKPKPAGSGTGK